MGGRDNGGDWHQITSLDQGGRTHSGSCERPQLYTATTPATGLHFSIVDPTQSQRPRALNTPTFLVGWHRFRAPVLSNLKSPIVLDTRFKGAYLSSSCAPFADTSQIQHSRVLIHPTFQSSRLPEHRKDRHRSRHPFHTALISRRLVLPCSALR